MASQTTMRRAVTAAGGYYNREMKQWVLPGAMHNCAPFSTETQRFLTLGEAYDASESVIEANQRVREFGEREGALLRRNR